MTCVWWIVIKKELKTKIYDKSERESTSFYDGKSVLGWLIFYVVCLVYKTEHFFNTTDAVISWHPENKSKPQNYSKKSHYITHCGVFFYFPSHESVMSSCWKMKVSAPDETRLKTATIRNERLITWFFSFFDFFTLSQLVHISTSRSELNLFTLFFSLFQVNKSPGHSRIVAALAKPQSHIVDIVSSKL